MKLIFSLLKDSLGLSIVAVVAGIVAGIGNTLMLGFVNNGLANRSSDMMGRLVLSFIIVCAVVAGSRFLSQGESLPDTTLNPSDLAAYAAVGCFRHQLLVGAG